MNRNPTRCSRLHRTGGAASGRYSAEDDACAVAIYYLQMFVTAKQERIAGMRNTSRVFLAKLLVNLSWLRGTAPVCLSAFVPHCKTRMLLRIPLGHAEVFLYHYASTLLP